MSSVEFIGLHVGCKKDGHRSFQDLSLPEENGVLQNSLLGWAWAIKGVNGTSSWRAQLLHHTNELGWSGIIAATFLL